MVSFVGTLLIGAMLAYLSPTAVEGHGYLWDPPGRSSMWRQNFKTPENYNDNELNCGGLNHQISLGYKCGLCGDPYDRERKNEEGGIYATGVISRTYEQGQVVTIQVLLTANHQGYFEFKLCPKSSSSMHTTQECLDQYPLVLKDGTGSQYKLNSNDSKMYDVDVVLPAGVTCDYCVIQWRYHAGNNEGVGPDGKSCHGCGFQEEFYGCADVRIVPTGAPIENPPFATPSPPRAPETGIRTQAAPGKTCRAVGVFATVFGSDTWCVLNCPSGVCSNTQCSCN